MAPVRPVTPLPAEVVFHASWWNRHAGITFDREFFFHPARRVEDEQRMENVLYERWGHFGLGKDHKTPRPTIGAVHLAAGFLVSAMMGCEVVFQEAGSPIVKPNPRPIHSFDESDPFQSAVFHDFRALCDTLRTRFGYLCGDVDWNGILNNSLDLLGQELFLAVQDDPSGLSGFFQKVAHVCQRFFSYVRSNTGTTSIAVNRTVRHLTEPLLLHSHCSHTMLGVPTYEKFLLSHDIAWAQAHRPYGIHYCGSDLHRFVKAYRRIEGLAFLDVGWGSDVSQIRRMFPEVFLNLRLSPVELVRSSPEQIRETIIRLVSESGNLWRTGVCCINVDDTAREDQVTAILETAAELRKRAGGRCVA